MSHGHKDAAHKEAARKDTAHAEILASDNLSPAVTALLAGNVIGMPTETVYGLAGNAFDVAAVTKIFQAKERPSFDPLIVHIPESLKSVHALAAAEIVNGDSITPGMRKTFDALAHSFWPGPLTMIVPKHSKIPDLVTSGLDRVGVRMPSHPVAQEILRECQRPLAAPSANRFGRISPTTAKHVMEELGDRIPYIVDGGPCDIGVESTVIAIDEDRVWLLRPGKISMTELSAIVDVPVVRAPSIHEKASPGMLASHYAPKKNMYVLSSGKGLAEAIRHKSCDVLVTSGEGTAELQSIKSVGLAPNNIIYLSKAADAAEAAKGLFAAMRTLDSSASDIILVTAPPANDGLWFAIEDRLHRASSKL